LDHHKIVFIVTVYRKIEYKCFDLVRHSGHIQNFPYMLSGVITE